MRYVEFKKIIKDELRKTPDGLTWVELRDRLNLPYIQPCPTWIKQLEDEIGLTRVKGSGRALVWKL
jgi:hypothetical protein